MHQWLNIIAVIHQLKQSLFTQSFSNFCNSPERAIKLDPLMVREGTITPDLVSISISATRRSIFTSKETSKVDSFFVCPRDGPDGVLTIRLDRICDGDPPTGLYHSDPDKAVPLYLYTKYYSKRAIVKLSEIIGDLAIPNGDIIHQTWRFTYA